VLLEDSTIGHVREL